MTPQKQEVLALLPPYQGLGYLISEEQTIGDIISAIKDCHKRFSSHYDRIALLFYRENVKDICDCLYFFCTENMPYKEEPETRQTTRPPAGMLTGENIKNDCKHYASFIGGVLSALNRAGNNISWCYRFASYRLTDKEPHHVFVVVDPGKDELWIDPVPGAENKSPVWVLDKKINDMALVSYVAGVDNYGSVVNATDLGYLPESAFWADGFWHFPVNDSIGNLASTALSFGDTAALAASNVVPVIGPAVASTGISIINGLMSLVGGSSTPASQKVYQMFPLPAVPTADNMLQLIQAVHAHFDSELSPPVGTSSVPTSGDTSGWAAAVAALYQKYGAIYSQLSGVGLPTTVATNTLTSTSTNPVISFFTANPLTTILLGAGAVLLFMQLRKKGHATAGASSKASFLPLALIAVATYFFLSKKKTATPVTTAPVTSLPVKTGTSTNPLMSLLQNIFPGLANQQPVVAVPVPSYNIPSPDTTAVQVSQPTYDSITAVDLSNAGQLAPVIDMSNFVDTSLSTLMQASTISV